MKTRIETDFLGSKELPADVLWGIHTARAMENFQIPGQSVNPRLLTAYVQVKKAAPSPIRNSASFPPKKLRRSSPPATNFIFHLSSLIFHRFRAEPELQPT